MDNISSEDSERLLNSVIGDHVITKIAAFCFLPEYEELRDIYFEKFTNFPLLRYKIYSLYSIRNNKIDILNLSRRYRQRVKWHLYRLYRMRNMIIHAGIDPKDIQVLGEHLHSYVDCLILEVAGKISQSSSLASLGSVYIDTVLLVHKIETQFSSNEPVSISDINLLFSDYFYD